MAKKQTNETFYLKDMEIKIAEAEYGIDTTEKHVDTKLVVYANNDRFVLHAYNGTQNLMIQGKNYENLVKYLEPLFREKIDLVIRDIDNFNDKVKKTLGTNKPALVNKKKGSKPFCCPHCKIKTPTVGELKMHVNSSHSKIAKKSSRAFLSLQQLEFLFYCDVPFNSNIKNFLN